MNLHEYQAKKILASYGIPVPEGRVAASADEAVAAAQALGGKVWVVKAQVHAGGRGKAGGVKLARDAEQVRAAAAAMLGQRLVTKQTGAGGLAGRTRLCRVRIRDRARAVPEPDAQSRARAHRGGGLGGRRHGYRGSRAQNTGADSVGDGASGHRPAAISVHASSAFGLGLGTKQIEQFQSIVTGLYRLYLERDASLIEINPLIVTKGGALVALDAKLDIEANALFRQKEMAALRDPGQEDPMERRASEHDLNYVRSTATSPAWSMARAWRWRPWT